MFELKVYTIVRVIRLFNMDMSCFETNYCTCLILELPVMKILDSGTSNHSFIYSIMVQQTSH